MASEGNDAFDSGDKNRKYIGKLRDSLSRSPMTFSDLATYRLHSQQLVSTSIGSPVGMVSWFGALQGQEYAHTKWSLGLRLPGTTDAAIEAEFTEGTILRTHLLRPTWHFVSAQDIRWMLKLTAPRVHAANAFMYRQLELTDSLFRRCHEILFRVLEAGRQLTRAEINGYFRQSKIEAEGHRLSYLMMHAELEGVICSGARQGKQFTYALLDDRVPAQSTMSADESLAELTKRYFLSRGPATLKDFATWSGLTVSACREGINYCASLLRTEEIGGETYLFPSDTQDPVSHPAMLLLPIYDEFIMGYKNRDAMLRFRNSLTPAPDFRFNNTLVFEGQVIGTWKRTVAKQIELEFALFQPMTRAQRSSFHKAVHHYETYNQISVNLIESEYES